MRRTAEPRERAEPEASAAWEDEFRRWLAPFLDAFDREAQRRWAPVYLKGLLGPGDRKSVEPMAARVCPGETQQLHHFVAAAPWATGPLEAALAQVADQSVGGPDAVLIIDDTSLVKPGRHSVGVARQYCGALGKTANCQALVSLTLPRGEVPMPLALRLYLPATWASDPERRARAKVPEAIAFRTKGEIAVAELDRVLAASVCFGLTLADAGHGRSPEFRAAVTVSAPTKGPHGAPAEASRAECTEHHRRGDDRRPDRATGATRVSPALLAPRHERPARRRTRRRAGAGRRRAAHRPGAASPGRRVVARLRAARERGSGSIT